MDKKTMFAIHCRNTGFPLAIQYMSPGVNLPFKWLKSIDSIDYEFILPILTDGLRDTYKPYRVCAMYSLWNLLENDIYGNRVLKALPKIVFPLRQTLNVRSNNWYVIVGGLKTLQNITKCGKNDIVARGLIPYCQLLLTALRRYRHSYNVTTTDGINPNVVYNIAALCNETLRMFECRGGPLAYVNIKYIIPSY